MKRIPLTKGAFALVDDKDYDELSRHRWHLSSTGYACRSVHIIGTRRHKTVWLHRLLLEVRNSTILVDHINQDKLDNRRANLRICTKAQNGSNRGMTRANTSGFKGVTKHPGKGCKGWIAQVRAGGKNYYLGYFPTPELAALAYDRAAVLHFGAFAQLNETGTKV